jgi:hypothetical protein
LIVDKLGAEFGARSSHTLVDRWRD